MDINQYLKSIGIDKEPVESDSGSFVIDLLNSQEYGKMFSKLEKSEDLDILEDNQVIIEEGSSLVYESISQPILISLLADFEGDKYQIVINNIE